MKMLKTIKTSIVLDYKRHICNLKYVRKFWKQGKTQHAMKKEMRIAI